MHARSASGVIHTRPAGHRSTGEIEKGADARTGDLRKAELVSVVKTSEAFTRLSTRARSVFLTLWDIAGAAERSTAGEYVLTAWPKITTIAAREGCTASTVTRALNELRRAGLIVSVNDSRWCGKHNVYTIFIPSEMVEQHARDHQRKKAEREARKSRRSTAQTSTIETPTPAPSNGANLRHSLNPSRDPFQRTQPTNRDAGASGGGGVSAMTMQEQAEAIDTLRSLGVGMAEPALRAKLRGKTIDDIRWVDQHVRRQPNRAELGGGFVVSLLEENHAEMRKRGAQEIRAAREETDRRQREREQRERTEQAAKAEYDRRIELVNAAFAHSDKHDNVVRHHIGTPDGIARGEFNTNEPREREAITNAIEAPTPAERWARLSAIADAIEQRIDAAQREAKRLTDEQHAERERIRREEQNKRHAEYVERIESASDDELAEVWSGMVGAADRAHEKQRVPIPAPIDANRNATPGELRHAAGQDRDLARMLSGKIGMHRQARTMTAKKVGAAA